MIITGNRMPFILFVLIMLSVFILEKKTRKYFIFLSVITILVFSTTYKFNSITKGYFKNFYKTAIEIKDSTFDFIFRDFSEEELKLFKKKLKNVSFAKSVKFTKLIKAVYE